MTVMVSKTRSSSCGKSVACMLFSVVLSGVMPGVLFWVYTSRGGGVLIFKTETFNNKLNVEASFRGRRT